MKLSESVRFRDRREAGKLLAEAVLPYLNSDMIVYGLARGGVPVAKEISSSLNCPLEILIVRKIGHPDYPEYAIGAVAEDDKPLLNKSEASWVDPDWLDKSIKQEQKTIRTRTKIFRNGNKLHSPRGKQVIIVDDGMATGSTMHAALNYVLKHKPRSVIIGVPVASIEAVNSIKPLVDKFVYLTDMSNGSSIGQYYDNFPQLSNKEVMRYTQYY